MLTTEGAEVVKSGSHEARVYNAVDGDEGTSQDIIMVGYPRVARLVSPMSVLYNHGRVTRVSPRVARLVCYIIMVG